jgi:hypothetical protein
LAAFCSCQGGLGARASASGIEVAPLDSRRLVPTVDCGAGGGGEFAGQGEWAPQAERAPLARAGDIVAAAACSCSGEDGLVSDQLTVVAGILGHAASVRETRRRSYLVECSCGYTSSGRRRRVANEAASGAEARRYVTWHLEKAVRDARVAGRIHVTAGGNLAVEDQAGETHLVDV